MFLFCSFILLVVYILGTGSKQIIFSYFLLTPGFANESSDAVRKETTSDGVFLLLLLRRIQFFYYDILVTFHLVKSLSAFPSIHLPPPLQPSPLTQCLTNGNERTHPLWGL